MNRLLLFLSFVPFAFFAQTKWQVGSYLSTSFPNKSIMPKMSPATGLGLQLAFQPIDRVPIAFELKSNFGIYAAKTLEQTFYFEDLSSTTTNVSYSSNFNQIKFGAKYQIGNDFKQIRAYFTPQIGYGSMRSKIRIDDPADEDDCKPLAKETTQRSSGFTYGGELGIEVDMSKLFRKMNTENRHYLFASATFMNGFKPFEYVNIRYMKDHDHGALPAGGAELETTDENGRPITATFINVSNNNLHDHKIAELYKTGLQYWGFNVGYVIHF